MATQIIIIRDFRVKQNLVNIGLYNYEFYYETIIHQNYECEIMRSNNNMEQINIVDKTLNTMIMHVKS